MTTATIEPPVTHDGILEQIRALLPAIRERATVGERERAIPKESGQDFLDAGVGRMLVPKRHGGSELSLRTWVDVMDEVGAVDASHAWCAGLIAHHPHYLAQFPESAQAAVWADGPDVAIAAPFSPVMKAEPVAGGYRVSGEAGWASGINHSTWIIVGGMLPGEGPGPEWTLFLVPPGQYEVIDTWHTIGMRGTGSNSARLSNVFVPTDHTLRISDMREGRGPGAALSDNPIYRAPWATYAPLNFLVPSLGAARGALEYNRAWNVERSSKHGAQVSSYVSIQTRLARCGADLDTARWLIDRAVDTAESPEPPTLEERARVARDACRASELIVSTIDTVMMMSGANGYLIENPLQRAWRDIHLASSHVILNPEIGLALWGRQQLGLEPPEGALWY